MDLHSIQTYRRPQTLAEVNDWQSGYSWLAGGTWAYTEPQPQLTTLIDITQLGWAELEITPDGLTIGATCILSDLLRPAYPVDWPGVQVLKQAVLELASFKVQNVATVGGNLCLAIPAGTFAPAMVLLNARYELVTPAGKSRWVDAIAFQTGIKQTRLQPGELLRKIVIPAEKLQWQVDYQRICVASAGLAVSIVATAVQPVTQRVRVAIGAAIAVPCLLEFDHLPSESEVSEALDNHLPLEHCLNDSLASAAYRRHVTQILIMRSLSISGQGSSHNTLP
ncbi:MAG: FAD binding domain-containing protein [Thainema sp.]